MGNLSSLTVGRDVGRAKRPELDPRELRFAISADAHSSIGKALHVLAIDALIVATDDHRFTHEALVAALAEDPHPENVVGIVATAGTTNAGIVDDLEGLGRYAREHDLWFHVDGAYGGAAIFSPTHRHLFEGIRHADSFIVDPHKWLFAPLDCCALIYRHPTVARKVLAQQASYLDVLHEGDDDNYEWNPSDFGIHLSRRARGLPFWFSLVTNGTAAYESAVQHAIDLAQRTEDLIERGRSLRDGSTVESLHRSLSSQGMGARAIQRVEPRASSSSDRLRHPHQVGGRDGRAYRLPAPQYDRPDGPSDSRLHARLAAQQRVARIASGLAALSATAPRDATERLQYHAIAEVGRHLGVIVGRGDLDHVHTGHGNPHGDSPNGV